MHKKEVNPGEVSYHLQVWCVPPPPNLYVKGPVYSKSSFLLYNSEFEWLSQTLASI